MCHFCVVMDAMCVGVQGVQRLAELEPSEKREYDRFGWIRTVVLHEKKDGF